LNWFTEYLLSNDGGKNPGAPRQKGIIIPLGRLSPDALHGLIEEFVNMECTDSGYTDGSLEGNIEMVKRQLDRGDAFIVYNVKNWECQYRAERVWKMSSINNRAGGGPLKPHPCMVPPEN
jgi:uncharacterized protein YheU (UPF0270 family)